MFRIVFAILAVVLFLLDLLIVLVIPSAPPQLISVLLYGGLASLAATQLPI
jgi:hypothetical protein